MTDEKTESHTDIEARWLDLESTCSEAIKTSETVASHINDSAPAHQVVKLLRRQADLSEKLRRGLSDVESLAGTARTHGGQLAKGMKSLLDLETRNYQLLSSKGMRLSGPSRFSRSANQSRP